MMELFSEVTLLRKDGSESNAELVLSNKLIGLYFSAKWCPPCKQFTQKLADLHQELVKRKAPFEVVFISCDKNEDDMLSYMKKAHGNWVAVPFKSQLREELQSKFDIELIPKLLILSPAGDVVSKLGRKEVEDRGVAALRGWLTAAGISSARVKTPDFTKEDIFKDEISVSNGTPKVDS